MKKLLFAGLAITSLIAINAQEPLTARDYTTYVPGWSPTEFNNTEMSSNLATLAQGGIQPYTFSAFGQSHNGNVVIEPNGDYTLTITAAPASFQFTFTDGNGNTSLPATVTLTPDPNAHQEKG